MSTRPSRSKGTTKKATNKGDYYLLIEGGEVRSRGSLDALQEYIKNAVIHQEYDPDDLELVKVDQFIPIEIGIVFGKPVPPKSHN